MMAHTANGLRIVGNRSVYDRARLGQSLLVSQHQQSIPSFQEGASTWNHQFRVPADKDKAPSGC